MTAKLVKKLTDLRLPHDWWEKTRKLTRTFHLHLGPTNSGKTHTALERLKKCKKGLYCGPLRLLATEISERLNNSGVKCSLFTGQETRIVPGATHIACTVESLNLDHEYDCALIDEIQMIDNYSRGSAWTYAVLGLHCPEIHLTGEARSRKIVESLLQQTKDNIVHYNYKRLSTLNLIPPVTRLSELMPGDCLVGFSRIKCHALKNFIEKYEPGTCSIIYGRLPPQVRVDQAEKFNSGQHKYLISTDAIGMGLNYNINRIIFVETKKNDGYSVKPLTPTEIKQIAGRAGRFKNQGFVTGTSLKKLNDICIGMHYSYPHFIDRAGLSPMYEHIKEFAELYSLKNENCSYSYILQRFKKEAKLEKLYFLQSFSEACEIADGLEGLKLPHSITHKFCTASISLHDRSQLKILREYAELIKNDQQVNFGHFNDDLEDLELIVLENLYNMCEIYHSLAKKFNFIYFNENEEVIRYKKELSSIIQRKLNIESEKSYGFKFNEGGLLDIF